MKGLRIESYSIMNRILSIILLLIPLSAGATDNLVLQLDNMIKSAKTYDLAKEKRIASLRTLFGRTHHAFPKWKVCKDLLPSAKTVTATTGISVPLLTRSHVIYPLPLTFWMMGANISLNAMLTVRGLTIATTLTPWPIAAELSTKETDS